LGAAPEPLRFPTADRLEENVLRPVLAAAPWPRRLRVIVGRDEGILAGSIIASIPPRGNSFFGIGRGARLPGLVVWRPVLCNPRELPAEPGEVPAPLRILRRKFGQPFHNLLALAQITGRLFLGSRMHMRHRELRKDHCKIALPFRIREVGLGERPSNGGDYPKRI
jgi:hypothetical protein